MKTLSVFLILFCSVGLTQAQDFETRHVSDFDGIKASHGIKVVLKKQTSQSAGTIEVESRNVDPDDIETYVRGGILRIKFKNKSFFDWDDNRYNHRNVVVTVNYNAILLIESNTGALVVSEEVIKGEDLKLEASTGGEMELELDVSRVDADFSMGAVAEVTGQARILRIKASMGAEVEFRNLLCEIVEAKGNMGAFLEVSASKEADITSNMGSEVTIYGSPQRRYKSTSLGGEINFVGHY